MSVNPINANRSSDGLQRVFPILSRYQYEHFVAGISGGVISTLLLHPLDLIKIRFAVNDGRTSTVPKYNNLWHALNEIIKVEGTRGLYKGVVPNLLGSGSSWGLYFFFYNNIKTRIQRDDPKKPLSASMSMFAASNAGIVTLLITNPLWVIKTRLCLQLTDDSKIPESKRYHSLSDAFAKIYQSEGFRGFYRGLVPGLFGVSHGAIQFMTYEELKKYYNTRQNRPADCKLSILEYGSFAVMSKMIAAAVTYPYQVVRARLQDQYHNYRGTWHCIEKTWRFEGWRGFYKGLSANLSRVVPATAITLVVYENVSHYLRRSNVSTY